MPFFSAITHSLLYKKAGKEYWWGAFIPVFNQYIYITTAFKQKFWPLMFIPIGVGILSSIPLIGLVFSLFGLVYSVYLSYSFAKSFGKSTLQSVLYVFFPIIMSVVFLVDKSTQYVGPQEFITGL